MMNEPWNPSGGSCRGRGRAAHSSRDAPRLAGRGGDIWPRSIGTCVALAPAGCEAALARSISPSRVAARRNQTAAQRRNGTGANVDRHTHTHTHATNVKSLHVPKGTF